MKQWINLITESNENRVEMVTRLYGDALAKFGLSVDDFLPLDPSPNQKYLRWLVKTYIVLPYRMDVEEVPARLSMPNIGDISIYDTMAELYAATDKYAKRAKDKIDYNYVRDNEGELPEGWRAISVQQAHELNEKLAGHGDGSGVRGLEMLASFSSRYFSYKDVMIAAVINGRKFLDWSAENASHPKELLPAVTALATKLGVEFDQFAYDDEDEDIY